MIVLTEAIDANLSRNFSWHHRYVTIRNERI